MRPLFGLAIDRHLSAKQPSSLSNSLQAETILIHLVGIESNAPVSYLNVDGVRGLKQSHRHSRTLAVSARVGQRFLGDSINGVLKDGLQSPKLDVAAKLNAGTVGSLFIVSEVG